MIKKAELILIKKHSAEVFFQLSDFPADLNFEEYLDNLVNCGY